MNAWNADQIVQAYYTCLAPHHVTTRALQICAASASSRKAPKKQTGSLDSLYKKNTSQDTAYTEHRALCAPAMVRNGILRREKDQDHQMVNPTASMIRGVLPKTESHLGRFFALRQLVQHTGCHTLNVFNIEVQQLETDK